MLGFLDTAGVACTAVFSLDLGTVMSGVPRYFQ